MLAKIKSPLLTYVSKGRYYRGTTFVHSIKLPLQFLSEFYPITRITRELLLLVQSSSSKATFYNPSLRKPLSQGSSSLIRGVVYSSFSKPFTYRNIISSYAKNVKFHIKLFFIKLLNFCTTVWTEYCAIRKHCSTCTTELTCWCCLNWSFWLSCWCFWLNWCCWSFRLNWCGWL